MKCGFQLQVRGGTRDRRNAQYLTLRRSYDTISLTRIAGCSLRSRPVQPMLAVAGPMVCQAQKPVRMCAYTRGGGARARACVFGGGGGGG